MTISLTRITQALAALRGYESRLVVSLTGAELVALQDAVAKLMRLVEVLAAIVAAEVKRRSDEDHAKGGGLARRQGHANAQSMVAKSTGGSSAQANDLIHSGGLFGEGEGEDEGSDDPEGGGDTNSGAGGSGEGGSDGKARGRAPRYRHVAAAFESGEISAAKAALLRRTLDRIDGGDDGIERRIVARAIRLSLADLKKVCEQVVALWDAGKTKEAEKRRRDARFLSLSEGADGMTTLYGKLDPESAAVIATYLDAQVRAGLRTRQEMRLGKAEPGEAGRLRVDALVELARHGMRCDQPGSGVSTEVVIRIGYEDLKKGLGLGECDAISTPLSGGALRRLAVDAKLLPIVLGSRSQPLDVGYAVRSFTPGQRHALAERDGGCAFCHRPVAWCNAHHIDWWARDLGPTDLSNGVLLCVTCHHRIHDDGWQVKATATEVWFIPPASVDPERTPRQGGKAALHVPL
ncbi:HNH endonuclease [Demequina soli]|uniref:HNH endonuclease n=1 Tax=Demequina soli TaxID=1638987 RepID=UPI0007842852|nr:HNH endonuclease signature motif containing protein [Demequina soli]